MDKLKKIDMKIDGMHCATCAITVEKSLALTPGVKSSSVNFATGKASVEYDSKTASLKDLVSSVDKSGYSVIPDSITIRIGGIRCVSCAQTVSKALTSLEGVISAEVNTGTEMAYIKYNPALSNIKDMQRAIEDTGFQFLGTNKVSTDTEDDIRKAELSSMLIKIVIGFIVSAILMAIMFIHSLDHFVMSLLEFLITTPFLIWLAYPIFYAAKGALRNGTLNMDVMYAMGIGVAYFSSVLGTFSIIPDSNFLLYDTSLMLASFLMLGRYLEARAKGRTSTAIKALFKLQSDEASVIRGDLEKKISINEVIIGDIILMRPGERIPTDGIVKSGSGYVDESMITGEYIAVLKSSDDEVIGGTLLNSGSFQYEATRIGADTTLARIIRLVEEAQGSHPPVQRLADYVVKWFIPVVLCIALFSSACWYFILGKDFSFSIQVFISVVVVACPCALGLATPTAVTVGIGRGAELGILIRNGTVLEIADSTSLALFDKTGTITTGKPVVTNVDPISGDSNSLLLIAASLEKLSDHPLGNAILNKAESLEIKPAHVTGFGSIPGKGLSGEVLGKNVVLGNHDYLLSCGVNIKESDLSLITSREQEGKTAVLVSCDMELIGVISIADQIKQEAASCVSTLKNMHIKSGLLTGDNQITANTVAEKIGIDTILARILPDGKDQEVLRLQKTGEKVAFIGDGINDAPALARSDIGIAIGSGTDVAIESADIVLIKDNLMNVPAAIQLARKVMSRIKLNLFWAFAYNLILLPLAAGIMYPVILFRPEYGALAMAFSSVTIVTLSLLLKGYTPPALIQTESFYNTKSQK